jgi:hypothetical protein
VTDRFALALPGFVVLLLPAAAGCLMPQNAVPVPGTVLQATRDPAQYRSALPRDVQGIPAHGETRGQACRTMLSWPSNPPTPFLGSATAASLLPWPSFDVEWGNEGYAKATEQAVKAAGGGVLYDVRADLHTTAVLGILRFECVEIHALVAR